MKKQLLVFILCALTVSAVAQRTKISGKFSNNSFTTLTIASLFEEFKDTIKVNKDGSFSYETDKIKEPLTVNLYSNKLFFYAFLAPGYDLKIEGDGSDDVALDKTLKYSGLGAKSNAYWKDITLAFNYDTVKWMNKDPENYIKYLLNKRNTDVSIIKKDFGPLNMEPYSSYYRISRLNQARFEPLTMLLDRYGFQHNLNWDQMKILIAKLGMSDFQKELNNPVNLNSESFSILVYRFPTHCYYYKIVPYDKTKGDLDTYFNSLYLKLYSGKVYDFTKYEDVRLRLGSAVKQVDFDKLQLSAQTLKDPKLKTILQARIAEHEKETTIIKRGSPSPSFNLPDTTGKKYQLSDFKGKVVYIDLWASWCGPCIAETPHLKKVAEHYKGDDRLKIISIATWDAKNRTKRYEIIKKDGMDWLQLEDTDDALSKSYNVKGIPRFIIIDKQGNVVDAYAGRPSDGDKLLAVLDKEIEKNIK